MKIILDGMGGDNAPEAIVEGAVAASEETEHSIVIIGAEEIIKAELAKHRYDPEKISTVNATEIISNDDAPVRAVRSKKDSSIVKGINMVKMCIRDSIYTGRYQDRRPDLCTDRIYC